jgi:predicted aconitase with swiveling domain
VGSVIQAQILVPGSASGTLLVSHEPLSFWGGYDAASGEIIDRRHPLSGENGSGRVLALPFSRGSSTTTAVLLEAIRHGTAPAAILTTGGDTFFALAVIVAEEIYEKSLPILAIHENDFHTLSTGDEAELHEDGTVLIQAAGC